MCVILASRMSSIKLLPILAHHALLERAHRVGAAELDALAVEIHPPLGLVDVFHAEGAEAELPLGRVEHVALVVAAA